MAARSFMLVIHRRVARPKVKGAGRLLVVRTMYSALQFRNLPVGLARRVLHELLEVPHFHYIREISDLWLLFDDQGASDQWPLLAWAWITPWTDEILAIRMIDVPEKHRGHDYALQLITEVGELTGKELLPHGVIHSARNYWLKMGWPEECWLV